MRAKNVKNCSQAYIQSVLAALMNFLNSNLACALQTGKYNADNVDVYICMKYVHLQSFKTLNS